MEPLAELRLLIARHAGHGLTDTAFPGLKLMASDFTTQPVHHVSEPAFAVMAQGAKRAVLGDKLFEYGAGQYLVVSVDLPIASHVSRASAAEPFLGLGLILRPTAVATLLVETAASESASGELSGMGVSDAGTELLDAVVRLLRLLEHPRDLPVLGPMIEREILWRLLTGEQGAMLRQIGLADSRLSQIGRAIRWIRSHYAETFPIEELARLAAMSVSSFHRHFRAVTAMSPLQYQKQIRLQEARSRLLAQSEDAAAVGFSVGYESPSQFSREYSRLFGAPPGRDAARLRAGSPLERSVI
ncbi:bacterial regulatory helix-turn-helix s, AraC family protein [Collimonas fungivorans]|uniref:Bacterial regulatory helix-turn-helix s, AraC family protein n=1 Tax=Collimonas fungivorans TaxID=158899 RepID=A0A127P7Z7_9BURK|nr:AraC family transcriptional regulator [Collimonas fungivorans]AMO93887.1 bacterial regulatory helix-turn-helix s, AraC family protein [Collimonas fungivorans]